MKRVLLSVLGLLAAGLGVAHARQCRGIDFPEHVQVNGNELTLNGLGIRKATFLKVNVYVAALYVARPTPDPQSLLDPNTAAQLVLHFVRGVGVDDLRKAWSEGFEKTAKDGSAALAARVATLNSWMSDVKTDQLLSFVRIPGAGIQVSVNGTVKGTLPGADFARAFIAIWLGPAPPNPELQRGLLGGPCE